MDNTSGKWFAAESDYVSVNFTITIDRLSDDCIVGRFHGTLGYWPQAGQDTFPPDEIVTITDGVMKYTGRIDPVDVSGAAPRPPDAPRLWARRQEVNSGR
jgi:hypothetical protein